MLAAGELTLSIRVLHESWRGFWVAGMVLAESIPK
jgi:hypothetical protein